MGTIPENLVPARARRCHDCKLCVHTTEGMFCGPPMNMAEGQTVGTGEDLIASGAGPIYKAPESYCPQGRWKGLEPFDLEAMAAKGEQRVALGTGPVGKEIIKALLEQIKALDRDAARIAVLDLVELRVDAKLLKGIAQELQLI